MLVEEKPLKIAKTLIGLMRDEASVPWPDCADGGAVESGHMYVLCMVHTP